MNWKRKITLIAAFTLFLSQELTACGEMCGLYNTGGYNLYTFGIDLYTTIDFTTNYYGADYSGSNWGGSCGSMLSSYECAYDMSYLTTPTYYPTAGLCGTGCTAGLNYYPMPTPYSPYDPYNIMPPTMPMPYSPTLVTSVPPMPNPYYPPPYPTYPTYPTTPPSSGVPPLTYNPYNPTNNPTTPLPWGGCDNIVVMCPQPIPSTTPIYPYPTPTRTGGYTPYTNTVPTTPVRITVPRGVHDGT